MALLLIHPDPVSLLAAWPKDIKRIGPETYEEIRRRFPRIDEAGRVAAAQDAFQMEPVIAAAPDVALFTAGRGPSDEQIRQLQSVGIAVVFVDFTSRPFENLSPSLRILGRVVGRDARAEEFLAFRQSHLDTIASRLKTAPGTAPTPVFFESHAGLSDECCTSPGRVDIGDYIRFTGGHNIGADVIPGNFGKLNLEYIITRDPAVYIATGGPHLEQAGGLVLGVGYGEERARAALAKVAARPGIAQLSAVRTGRVHGFAHQLLHSPLDLIAIDAMARWLHPALFADLDPQHTLDAFNTRFLPFPLMGTLWVDLKPATAPRPQ